MAIVMSSRSKLVVGIIIVTFILAAVLVVGSTAGWFHSKSQPMPAPHPLQHNYAKSDGDKSKAWDTNTLHYHIPDGRWLKGEKGDRGPKGPPGDVLPGPPGPPGVLGNGACSCNLTEMMSLVTAHLSAGGQLKGKAGIEQFRNLIGLPGEKGAPGTKGERGDQGPRGYEGPQGLKGSPGVIGPPGIQGVPGPPGPPGPPEYVGYNELGTGPDGIKGEGGPRGSQGVGGDRGNIGSKGERGESGPKGAKGERGYQGDQGPQGAKGEPGVDGFPGIPGLPGRAGIKGEKGDSGSTGPPGPPGPQAVYLDYGEGSGKAIAGFKGDRGESGLKGEKGSDGPVGPPGHPGKDGNHGKQGEKGEKGPVGPKGERGLPGPGVGEKGERGKKGRRGRPGTAGPPGPPGIPDITQKGQKGEPGEITNPFGDPISIKGEKGEPGKDAVQYVPVPGPPGPPGLPGPPGIGQKGEPGGAGGRVYGQPTYAQKTGLRGSLEELKALKELKDLKQSREQKESPTPSESTLIVPGAVTFENLAAMSDLSLVSPVGTLAYIKDEEALLVRVNKGWQYIALGSLVSTTTEEPPQTTTDEEKIDSPFESSNLVNQLPEPKDGPEDWQPKMLRLAALNEAYSGGMKGQRGADYSCYRQARRAGLRGTFRAFLTSRVHNLDSLIRPPEKDLPIVNIKGDILFNSWKEIFKGDGGYFAQQPRIYSFSGKNILTDFSWPQKYIWHGSLVSGEKAVDEYCEGWESDSVDRVGLASSLHGGKLLGQEPLACNHRFAVLCIETGSLPPSKRRRRRESGLELTEHEYHEFLRELDDS